MQKAKAAAEVVGLLHFDYTFQFVAEAVLTRTTQVSLLNVVNYASAQDESLTPH